MSAVTCLFKVSGGFGGGGGGGGGGGLSEKDILLRSIHIWSRVPHFPSAKTFISEPHDNLLLGTNSQYIHSAAVVFRPSFSAGCC